MRSLKFDRLQQNNMHGKTIKYITVADGKEQDYTNPLVKSYDDNNIYDDIDFRRRSNEIKEIMKKTHKEVFGIEVKENEIRYCDVDQYDKKLIYQS